MKEAFTEVFVYSYKESYESVRCNVCQHSERKRHGHDKFYERGHLSTDAHSAISGLPIK